MFSLLSKTRRSFAGQLPDENTAVVLRMHWIFLLGAILAFVCLYLLPLVIFVLIRNILATDDAIRVYWLVVFIYYLVCWNGLFYRLTLYVLNTWIVTDHRIMAIEQHRLFHRTEAELTIVKVQDVEVTVSGFIATFLNYGDVQIQSAGEDENFLFKKVPNPAAVKDAIIKAQRDYQSSHPNNNEPDGM